MKGSGYHLAICLLLTWPNLCTTERVERQESLLDLHDRDDVGLEQDHTIIPDDNKKSSRNEGNIAAANPHPDGHAEQSTSLLNDTDNSSNDTLHATTVGVKATPKPTPKPILPGAGVKAQEEEQSSGMTIFFSLLVIGICIILVHLLIKFKLHFLPESVAVVSLGILMGGFIKIIEFHELANWKVPVCLPQVPSARASAPGSQCPCVCPRFPVPVRLPQVPSARASAPGSQCPCVCPRFPVPVRLPQVPSARASAPGSQYPCVCPRFPEEEMFRPNMFFLLLLPPIIFESGYSLHKGNFFQNIGSITLFAVIGTAISAFIVGGGIYFLGQADVIYKMSMTDSFAFGSLISAVDPVATIAIFNALNVDPVLNMLVFGESILNDAVSIVLTNTAEGFARDDNSMVTGWETFLQALGYFLKMFFGSAALGTLTGLISAIFLKHFDLRKTPSLEFGMMIIFAYLPYGLAEGIKLSGIMSILFSGIVMSHYTHHNLSPVTQILMQQTLRSVAFMCETCVFAFLGLSIFSFPHKFELSFVIWCIVLVLVGRAVNIFPLSYLLNFFRDHKITPKMMFIMWFSGLRGAIPYALSLHLGLEPIEKRQLIGTTTIIIVLFTILLLGSGTMPLIRIMDNEESQSRRKSKKDINLSKTEKMGNALELEHLSELTEEEYEAQIYQRRDLKGFMWLDAKYLNPFFTRRLTQEDLLHGRIQMKTLTNKWYEEVRQGPSGSEDVEDENELL
ncbi:sodium/hydrogen exchanger 8 isoform X3 [Salvelinus namaycush]|uniref:Sodium/hydrogen exchanger n=1 Tax=Salvelinus namaycush TaxID=8040 RepID=A0A8U0QFA5_SALNM|nr:sodium/hydrogen exchanger 8 isoform X3 [Salvelinus namaycush]